MFLRTIGKIYFKLAGWKIVGTPPDLKKYVYIVAPHTSQTDFILGKLYCAQIGIKPRILVKKESFFFPLGMILKSLGAVPVDRSKNTRLAEQLIERFNSSETFILTIAPEGTRKLVKRWKKGFYHIASQVDVPICCGVIDYKSRTIGAGPTIYPCGDYQKDLKTIHDFYRGMEGKHKDRFSLDF